MKRLGHPPTLARQPTIDHWVSPNTSVQEGRLGALRGLLLENEDKIKKTHHGIDLKTSSSGDDTMQVVTRPYILLGQCFALIPVRGIMSDNPEDLVFTWKARRVMYVLAVLVLATGVAVLQMSSSIILYGLNYRSVDDLISILLTVVQISIFLGQARSWPEVMREWSKVEVRTRHFRPAVNLRRKVNCFVITFCLGTLALIITRLMGPLTRMASCSDSILEVLKLAFVAKYVTLLSLIGYSFGKMVAIVWIFMQQNVLIVYDELTITVLAYCLYIKFRQLNQQLNSIKNKRLPVTFWAEMRELYNSLSCLTKVLDNHLSWMTLVCFGANLYHICSLLLRIISPDNNVWTNISFMYSLLFTMTRTFLAALMASSIHEESKRPLATLYSVPSDGYNGEVYRFQIQATHDEIAITGCNFFSLNRSFMLTVAGTIATYEIVLLQFNSLNDNSGPSRNMTNMCSRVLDLASQ